ncbi:hypothetical protein F7734_54965 [Scytonema sp. UIC 10036]|nr:hypothetical protein [Scytonema sp. UIC 10036]MUH00893.1 hypothetical protein [Scytonema sp. UIC 10036]
MLDTAVRLKKNGAIANLEDPTDYFLGLRQYRVNLLLIIVSTIFYL